MAWIIVVVPLTLGWNLIMLSGMLGGRVTTPWPRRLLTFIQVALFAAWFAVLLLFLLLVAKSHSRGQAAVALFLESSPALLAGTLLTYVEYVIAGRRHDFQSDLLRIRWFGR